MRAFEASKNGCRYVFRELTSRVWKVEKRAGNELIDAGCYQVSSADMNRARVELLKILK